MEFDKQMIADVDQILNKKEKNNDYYLPITELDGLRVKAKLHKHISEDKKNEKVFFTVGMKSTYHIWDKQLNAPYLLYCSEDLKTTAKALKFVSIFLENFSVDKVNGEIVTVSNPVSQTEVKLAAMFRKNPRVKVNVDECCVCKDTETKTKTPCGHHVCISCISKLPTAEDDPDHDCDEYDGHCHERKCPMCRQVFCQI